MILIILSNLIILIFVLCILHVQELFGAVGALRRARLVKPGTAEVVFVRCDDALNAVKKYHLRELDSKCSYS